jgi:hypothetical protein
LLDDCAEVFVHDLADGGPATFAVEQRLFVFGE